MGRFIDLTGQNFGRLTVVERAENTNHGAARWRCKCECGKETIVIGDELRKGATRSCGCLAKEVTSNRMKGSTPHNKTHGQTGTLVYQEWTEMKRRCFIPNDTSYHNYGARGIIVCDRWRNSFEAFYEDVSKLPNFGKEGYSLNRIDNDGNYEPNNVEWADAVTQANNRRNNVVVCYGGKQFTISQLAKTYGIKYQKLYKRIVIFHWNIERAVNTP